jgi:hypothetical protein
MSRCFDRGIALWGSWQLTNHDQSFAGRMPRGRGYRQPHIIYKNEIIVNISHKLQRHIISSLKMIHQTDQFALVGFLLMKR